MRGNDGVMGAMGEESGGVVAMRRDAPQDGVTALLAAARTGRTDAMALLLDRGADLEAKTKVSFSGRASQLLPRLR